MDHSQQPSLKKCEIAALWQKCISGAALKTSITTGAMDDSTLDLDSNASVQRLVFVLGHYQTWIQKAKEKTLKSDEISCMQELLHLLQGYNPSSVMGDYMEILGMIKTGAGTEDYDGNVCAMEDELKVNHSNVNNNNNSSIIILYMDRQKPLFHGINCKLLFGRFNHQFAIPTSLTTSKRVAERFASKNGGGIILVLTHAGEMDSMSLTFDVSVISHYPDEKERLIFNSRVQFADILMDGISYKPWMEVLKFYERIKGGSFLSHIPFSMKKQAKIARMMEDYLADAKATNAKNAEVYENGRIPNYVQRLFNECTGGNNACWLNSHAINRAISDEQLLQYLDVSQKGKNPFLSVFRKVREVHEYEWRVSGESYDSYFHASHPWVIGTDEYRINLAPESEHESVPMPMVFHWELQNHVSTGGLLACKLVCSHLPSKVRKVDFALGIFVRETQSESYVPDFVHHSLMSVCTLHSIVDSNRLWVEQSSDAKQKEFHLKLSFVLLKVEYN